MSEEKKVNEVVAEESPQIPTRRWPIVVSVLSVIVIAILVAFLHWHESPTFCNVICHQPMDKYVEGYYSEDSALSVSNHAEAGVTCLSCHWPQAKMLDLVHEVVMWVGDEFTDPLPDQAPHLVNDEFCGRCHDGETVYGDVTVQTKEAATAELIFNPHELPASHTDADGMVTGMIEEFFGGPIECSDCHRIHKQSVYACALCHGEAFAPEGWAVPEGSHDIVSAMMAPAQDEDEADADAEAVEAPAADAELADGTYEASGKGIGGDVPVTVTIEGGVITSVEVGDNGETQGIGTNAIEQLPDLIVAANGTNGVDAVGGASVTSGAIFDAVNAALAQAAA